MLALTLEQQEDIVQKWRASPIVRHYSLSDKKLWLRQEEVLWSVRKNKRTAVRSGNTVGKTFTAADVVIDWLITLPQSVVVTTAPTFHQVETILWREIRQICYLSKIPLGVEPLQTELRFNDKWYAIGLSTDKPVNFQGKHSESGNLLVVLDEASGINREIWEMVDALHPKAILAIGNPLESTGPFAECFNGPAAHLWNQITISCQECVEWQQKNGLIPGLVTRDWIKDMAELHGLKSIWFRVHCLGLPPEQDEQALIERKWVERARKGLDSEGMPLDEEFEDDETRIISFDIASKHGSNETVIGYRYGHSFKYMEGFLHKASTWIRDEVQALYSKHAANIVVHDADGIGEPMQETLSEAYVPSEAFHGGSGQKALSGKFRNLRSQFYWIIAKKFEKGLYNLKGLDPDVYEILLGQLCSIRTKRPDALGRFQIETKEDMLSRQIKSPDYADCFMMSEYGHYMHKFADLRPRKMGPM